MVHSRKKVFVAMSGGVDSSVVAGLMKEQGYDVIGVTMCFSISYPQSKKPSCCGEEGIADAKRVAQMLDIPHYVLDFAGDLQKYIIDDFVREYLHGRTPNPCVRCNQFLKFGILYEKVRSMGADFLATGHYGIIEYNRERNCFEMKRARDARKDQSYFLYSMPYEALAHVLFPLGSMDKNQVRALARRYQLNIADKPESQDICFIPETGYQQFIADRVGRRMLVPGDFIDHEGKVVGRHKGIANYTIGQREKLGLALGVPVYVYHIDARNHTVHVGPKEYLYAKGLKADQFNWLRKENPKEKIEVDVQIRYNAPTVKGRLKYLGKNNIHIDFVKPQPSVTPGQSVVLYEGNVVLGGGIIKERIE